MNVIRTFQANPHLYFLSGLVAFSVGGGAAATVFKARRDPTLQFTSGSYDEALKSIKPNQNIKFYTVNKQFFRDQPSENEHDFDFILSRAEESI